MSAYRRLPRWARWTIPVVVVLLVIGAASSSSQKGSRTTAADSAHTTRTTSTTRATHAQLPAHTQAAPQTNRLGWVVGHEPDLKTHAQVVAAVDAICRSMSGKTKKPLGRVEALKEEAEAPVREELPPLLQEVGKALFSSSLDLQDLPVSAADKSHVERLAEAIGATGTTYGELGAAITVGDTATAKTDEHEIERTAQMIDGFAARYGFSACEV